ncbi:MAG TPA: helix-turn-helix domain-containing protein [Phycisphaerales bacterium]|nr:helix-turn-helix domain-containing protein [Phycisphaerales bacterium]
MEATQTLLSPNDLARAIGVSESSLKRWVDRGEIRAVRTLGGHRRIPLEEAVRFIRHSQHPVVDPAVLGMAEATGHAGRVEGPGWRALAEALKADDHAPARGMLLAAYLSGTPIARIADELIHPAMEELGGLWKHGSAGIMVEHRATDTCIQTVSQIRSLIQTPEGAPVAVGGGAPGDPYVLGSLTAAATLADEGFRAVNLGPDTPLDVLAAAAREYGASLVWLSLSSQGRTRPSGPDLAAFAQAVSEGGAKVALGGRALPPLPAPGMPGLFVGKSMSELAAFAGGVRAGAALEA